MRHRALGWFYWGATSALALPLVVAALASLSAAAFVAFPPGPPTLQWYRAALADPAWREAAALSTALAVVTGAGAVALGGTAALAIGTLRPGWRAAAFAVALLPAATPGIVHALSLRIATAAIGLGPGPLAIAIGHVIHAAPYAVLVVAARRATLPPELLDAARDLGAGRLASFAGVVLPWLRPSLLAAAALAGLSSFDDFVRSFFLGGYDPTLPVLLFARIRSGLTPEVDAVATAVVLLALLGGGLADRVTGRGSAAGSPGRGS